MVQAMLLVGCAAARCSGCAWVMSGPASDGCSSPRARAVGNGSCRSRVDSSPRWATTSMPNDHARRALTGSSSYSRDHPGSRALSAAGLDEILAGARGRAGLARLTCHQLRHTCFTRLREAGMALEAIQAQAGHASIESTRIYLHLANDWLAGEYLRAAEAIEAQAAPVPRRRWPVSRSPRRVGRAGRRLPGPTCSPPACSRGIR